MKKPKNRIQIQYAITHSTLGKTLIAQSPHGICAILFADEEDSLLLALIDQFPHHLLTASSIPEIASILAVINGEITTHDLPLDITGTAFQKKVWALLSTIPYGQTMSYSDIAVKLKQPSAVRAVAAACAANAIAILIPCHRVIKKDGQLSGYRFGIERKKRLLDREATN